MNTYNEQELEKKAEEAARTVFAKYDNRYKAAFKFFMRGYKLRDSELQPEIDLLKTKLQEEIQNYNRIETNFEKLGRQLEEEREWSMKLADHVKEIRSVVDNMLTEHEKYDSNLLLDMFSKFSLLQQSPTVTSNSTTAQGSELIQAYEDYIELLANEVEELVLQVGVKGWKSNRDTVGIAMRDKILSLKANAASQPQGAAPNYSPFEQGSLKAHSTVKGAEEKKLKDQLFIATCALVEIEDWSNLKRMETYTNCETEDERARIALLEINKLDSPPSNQPEEKKEEAKPEDWYISEMEILNHRLEDSQSWNDRLVKQLEECKLNLEPHYGCLLRTTTLLNEYNQYINNKA